MKARDRLVAAGRLEEHVPLAPLTTYKVGGAARYLVTAVEAEDVLDAAALGRDEGLPVMVLGRGSNVVIADRGLDAVVVRPAMDERRFEGEQVEAGAGTPLPLLARDAARAGRGGLEFYAGIPGSVGGAVRMNAGCHGSDTAEWLVAARIVDLRSGVVAERPVGALGLAYRHSDLGDDEVVVSARFRTVPCDPAEAEARIREVTRWRKEHQPGGTLNAGSVFKNPPGDAAGRIIDALGLKGLRVGGAEVSTRHANFIVAGEGATAADLHALVILVRDRVAAATGIVLEPEMRFLGDFS